MIILLKYHKGSDHYDRYNNLFSHYFFHAYWFTFLEGQRSEERQERLGGTEILRLILLLCNTNNDFIIAQLVISIAASRKSALSSIIFM